MNSSKRFTLLITFMIGTLVALTACGDSGPAAQPTAVEAERAVQPTATLEPALEPVPTANPEHADPPEISVIPSEVPEPGSVEEKLLAALERQVRAINTQDWGEFVAQCSQASTRKLVTLEKVKYAFEEFGGLFGFDIPTFSIYGYNARAVEFTIYSADNARTTFDIYDHDSWVATGVSRTWQRVGGEWYGDGAECYPT